MATFTKVITENEVNYRMEVVVKLSTTNHTYFSITYSQYKERGTKMLACGASSETILKYFPELSDVLAMHLSDSDGVPMHALENGFYYMQNPEDYSSQVVADHFRVSLELVPVLATMSKESLDEWIEAVKPNWKIEAQAMIAKYGLK